MYRIIEVDVDGKEKLIFEGLLKEAYTLAGFKGGSIKEFKEFLNYDASGSLFYDYILEEV